MSDNVYGWDATGTPVSVPTSSLGGEGGTSPPWPGTLHALWGDGNPAQYDVLWSFQNTVVSVAGPTPTGIGVTVGRLVNFRYEKPITVDKIRYFAIGTVANAYTVGIYAGTSRLYTANINTVAGWNTIDLNAAPVTIPADTLCWFGVGTRIVGTTAGFRTPASPIANSLGVLTIPGKLATHGPRFAQVALTTGAWPVTLPTLAAATFASAGTTGTVPIFYAEDTIA